MKAALETVAKAKAQEWRLADEIGAWSEKQAKRLRAMKRDVAQGFIKMKDKKQDVTHANWTWLEGSRKRTSSRPRLILTISSPISSHLPLPPRLTSPSPVLYPPLPAIPHYPSLARSSPGFTDDAAGEAAREDPPGDKGGTWRFGYDPDAQALTERRG
eukprot:2785574-Pyramimonas_sp.AAC.1